MRTVGHIALHIWDELRLHSLRSQGVRVAVASSLARSLPNFVGSMGASENGTPKKTTILIGIIMMNHWIFGHPIFRQFMHTFKF